MEDVVCLVSSYVDNDADLKSLAAASTYCRRIVKAELETRTVARFVPAFYALDTWLHTVMTTYPPCVTINASFDFLDSCISTAPDMLLEYRLCPDVPWMAECRLLIKPPGQPFSVSVRVSVEPTILHIREMIIRGRELVARAYNASGTFTVSQRDRTSLAMLELSLLHAVTHRLPVSIDDIHFLM
jgi:hypothetical protein